MTLFLSKIRYWLPAIIWMGVIFFLSSRASVRAAAFDPMDFLIKKFAHFVEYFALYQFIYYGLNKSTSWTKIQKIIISLVLTTIYAGTDEYHQTFVAGREGRVRDVLIDSLGAVVSARIRHA